MFQNIWQHPKTTIAGLLVGAITVAGVLTQQGITLGKAGTGTVVALVGAIAAALLGLLAKDPGTSTTSAPPNGPTRLGLVLLCALVTLGLAGCPSQQRQQVAQALQTASTVVQSFQQAEIVSHNQGIVSDDDHRFIEQQLLTVAQAGKTADTCVKTTTSPAGDIACVNTMISMVDQVNSQGGLYIKSDQAKKDFQFAMVGLKAALQTVTVILGGGTK